MKTTIRIPRVLTGYADSTDSLCVDGDTINELLRNLARSYPRLHGCICDETGTLRKHIHLFVNNDLIDRAQFDQRFQSGDIVYVFQAVSGG